MAGKCINEYDTFSGNASEVNILVQEKSQARPAEYKHKKVALDIIIRTLVGIINGIAPLGSDGKVPSAYLPSFVDDVAEGYLYENKFYAESTHETELLAETNKIYIDLTDEVNKTYRWSGSLYVEISPSLALGETSSTAYRGDRGKSAYDHATDQSKVSTAGSATPTGDGTNKYKLNLPKIDYTGEGHIAGKSTRVFEIKPVAKSTSYGNSHDVDITPAGSVSKPNVTVTPTEASTLASVNSAGATPSWSASVADEVLSFSFSAGSMPTFNTANRLTAVSAELASAPSFTGTGKHLMVEIADVTT